MSDSGESASHGSVDPATVEVVRNYLVSAANEMQRTLIRTAYNPVIYEMVDFGISIYDRELNLIADSPGLSLFLGANDYGIVKGVEHVGEENMNPGDIIMLNYPYWSGAHTLDVCLFAPVFYDETLVGYTVIRAHWLGIGQKDDGYVLDSTSVHQEGLLFPGTKVYKGGEPDEEILDLLRFNTRGPNKILGDLNAQIAAIQTGKRRLVELYERYGESVVKSSVTEILDHGEQQARDAVRELPDGSWSAVDYLDKTFEDGEDTKLVELAATVTIDGDEFTVDFSASSDQVPGPINVPFGMTETIGKLCLKTLTTPTEPSNGGHFEPVTVIAPEGNLYHATYPAPTFTIWPAILGIDVVFKAVSQGMPERIPASSGGDVCSVAIYGRDPDTGHIFLDATNEGCGWGGFRTHDGENGLMHISECAIRNTPVEVFEARAPVRFEQYQLRQDSGGPGRHRGGLGVRRDYRLLDTVNAFTTIMKTRQEGWGLEGGEPGSKNAIVLDDLEDDWSDRLTLFVDNNDLYESKSDRKYTGLFRGELKAGELLSDRTGGGGGYGDPFERDPEAVRNDVVDGYVSRAAARERYGVAVTETGELDHKKTAELRSR